MFKHLDRQKIRCYNQDMDTNIKKKYPYVGKVSETEGRKISNFEHSSPWKDAQTAFYWENFEYPLYHGHQHWEIQIILNDQIEHYLNGMKITLSSGSAILVGPNDNHAIYYPKRQKNQFQGVCFISKSDYFKNLCAQISPTIYTRIFDISQGRTFSLSPSFIAELTNSLLEIQNVYALDKEQAKERCNILFYSVFSQFLMQNQLTKSIPSELAAFIKNLNNPKLSSEELKALQMQLPYSYCNLTRLIKKHTGCTITQYVNNVKLQYAKELLRTTQMTTLMIAQEIHFESLSHFNHLFKKQFQMTPTEFRKQSTAKTL